MKPKGSKLLNEQARQMIYDVNCFMKTESVELVTNLKQVKSQIKDTNCKLIKDLTIAINEIKQFPNKTEPSNILQKYIRLSMLTDTCNKLENIRQYSAENTKEELIAIDSIMNSLKSNHKRTASATRASKATVGKITAQVAKSGPLAAFKMPGKKCPRAKPVTDINYFDQGVIRRCLHSFHITNKDLPTIEKIGQKLQEDINYQGSEQSLHRIINNLGFRWKKVENNRKILIETSNIRYQRIEYLRKIKKFRQEGRPIIYTDESYYDSAQIDPKDSRRKGLIPKGQGVIIVHAGSEAGFVPNALLTFKAGTKSGHYHDSIYYENYEKWLRMQLIPNLPTNSVVVVDDASYYSKQWDIAPTSNSKKSDMQAWLKEKGIVFNADSLKPELYHLIKVNKDHQYKTFSIDRILAEHNHNVLRLPPHHLDLNPIQMVWSTIKQYVAGKNGKWNVNPIVELIKEKVASMEAQEWVMLCKKVKDIEEEYTKNDHIIDRLTEEVIIHADTANDSSDSEITDGIISDDEDRMSTSDDDHGEVLLTCSEIKVEFDVEFD